MRLDPLHPRVTRAYQCKATRNLILLDVMHENYKRKKKDVENKFTADGKRITDHFSVREDELTDFELFEEDEDDAGFSVSFAAPSAEEEMEALGEGF